MEGFVYYWEYDMKTFNGPMAFQPSLKYRLELEYNIYI